MTWTRLSLTMLEARLAHAVLGLGVSEPLVLQLLDEPGAGERLSVEVGLGPTSRPFLVLLMLPFRSRGGGLFLRSARPSPRV